MVKRDHTKISRNEQAVGDDKGNRVYPVKHMNDVITY
jgi:hypothetical protein